MRRYENIECKRFDVKGDFFYLLSDGKSCIKYGMTSNSLLARIRDAQNRFNENLEPILLLSFTEDGEALEFERHIKKMLPWGAFFTSEFIHIKGDDEDGWKYVSMKKHILKTIFFAYGGYTDNARVEFMNLDRESELFFAHIAGRFSIGDEYFDRCKYYV